MGIKNSNGLLLLKPIKEPISETELHSALSIITMLPQIRSTLFRSAAPLRAQAVRGFRSCAPSLIQVGDSIPSVSTLREGSPGNEVDLAQLTKTVSVIESM